MTYVIAEPCVDVKDKRCVDECPVDAIYYQHDVPEPWQGYTAINADFFDELGSPCGASEVGATANDPTAVKQLPPMGAFNRSRSRKYRITETMRGSGDSPANPQIIQ